MGRVGACSLGLLCALACQGIIGIEDTSVREPGGDASAGAGGAGGGVGGAGGTNGGSSGAGGASASGGSAGSAGAAGDAGGDVANCDDFIVTQPAAVSLVQGDSIQVNVQVSLGSCFDSPIEITAPTVNEIAITPLTLPSQTNSGSLTVQTQPTTPFGTSVLKLTFSGGGKSHPVDLSVTVKGEAGEPVGDFNSYSAPGSPVRALAVNLAGEIVIGLNPGGPQNGWAVKRLKADGNPDMSFSPATMPQTGALMDLTVGPNGAIVMTGDVTTGNGAAVMRLNASGGADVQLGPGGIYEFPTAVFPNTVDPLAVAAPSDGRILAAGGVMTLAMFARIDPAIIDPVNKIEFGHAQIEGSYRFVGSMPSRLIAAGTRDVAPGDKDVYVRAVVPPNGNDDPSFGSSGTTTYDVGLDDLVHDGVITPNAIYLVGAIHHEPGYKPTLFRVSSDGKMVTHTAVTGNSAYNYQYFGAAAQSDGRVVAVGAGGTTSGGFFSLITRFNADGSLDTTFGSGGSREFGNGMQLRAVAVAPDGTIVVGGTDPNGGVVFKVWN